MDVQELKTHNKGLWNDSKATDNGKNHNYEDYPSDNYKEIT